MKLSLLLGIVLVGVMTSSLFPTCEAQAWQAVAAAVAEKIAGLWVNDEMELLGHTCNYRVDPKIKRFQLYFKGRMWCPGWTPIRGEAETRSRSGVVGKTTQDFVTKAFKSGLISEDEARVWLNSKK
ncbi:anti-lipopolysaccharide factor-like [Palaemon carinicauda]|uniref:anti-lipopolysaccharide factor-like n=1 Tax=Palaemon carinicauda TaxID=392227 RepID=UPI0035B64D32